MYIYRNSLVLHLHSISIMRCWMGRMQLYIYFISMYPPSYFNCILFYAFISYPSILCVTWGVLNVAISKTRFKCQNTSHPSRCETFGKIFSPQVVCGKSRWRVSHTIKYFRMRFWCILNAWWRCAERKCIWSQKPQCIFRTDFPRIQYVSLQPPHNSINASRFPFTKCDTVVWALCLTACCYVWLPNKHFMSQASWSHGKLVNCLKRCITRGESFPFFSPPFYVCSSSRFSNPYPPLGSPFSQPFWPGHN